jgi:hypothetical protein
VSASGRDFLVFFRSGPSSLHRRLLAEDPQRNWDCAISYWASAQPPDDLAEMYSTGGGNKFDGFVEFWRTDPRARGYRYYLLLDDDVYFAPGDISRLLAICDRHKIELAQPALQWSTFFNHNVTVENPICELRRVSFVEVMAACFSAPTLERLLPTFSESRSTWGIDWAWACLMRDHGSMHVVDTVAIDHTKVVDVKSGALYRKLRAEGVDFMDELNRARTQYGEFGRRRTRFGGHVYRKGIPTVLGLVLVHVFESFKVFARQQKKLKRYWHKRAATAR